LRIIPYSHTSHNTVDSLSPSHHKSGTFETNCLPPRIPRTDQPNQQHGDYRHSRASQEFFPQPIRSFRDPNVTYPIRHHQDIGQKENDPNQSQHKNLSNCQTHHLSLSKELIFTNIDDSALHAERKDFLQKLTQCLV